MKKKDQKSIVDILREASEKLDRESPVLATRWFVVEVTPAQKFYDGYDYVWSDKREDRVSKFLDSEGAALRFIDAHEPDDGNTLEVRHQNLREYKHKRWGV